MFTPIANAITPTSLMARSQASIQNLPFVSKVLRTVQAPLEAGASGSQTASMS
jgi:hypothetical protein